MAGNFWQSSHCAQWVLDKVDLNRERSSDLNVLTEEEYNKIMIFYSSFIQVCTYRYFYFSDKVLVGFGRATKVTTTGHRKCYCLFQAVLCYEHIKLCGSSLVSTNLRFSLKQS